MKINNINGQINQQQIEEQFKKLSGYQSHIVDSSIDAETDTLVDKECSPLVEKYVQMSGLNFTESSP